MRERDRQVQAVQLVRGEQETQEPSTAVQGWTWSVVGVQTSSLYARGEAALTGHVANAAMMYTVHVVLSTQCVVIRLHQHTSLVIVR